MRDEARIKDTLRRGQVGFIATAANNQPFIVPNLYWFDEKGLKIYFHTALEGRTRQNVEHNPRVCMSVAEMGRLLPAGEALKFSVEYASVCVFGRARIVREQDEAQHGLQGMLDKYFPQLKAGADYRPITEAELAQTSVFAIEIDAWSGKEKAA